MRIHNPALLASALTAAMLFVAGPALACPGGEKGDCKKNHAAMGADTTPAAAHGECPHMKKAQEAQAKGADAKAAPAEKAECPHKAKAGAACKGDGKCAKDGKDCPCKAGGECQCAKDGKDCPCKAGGECKCAKGGECPCKAGGECKCAKDGKDCPCKAGGECKCEKKDCACHKAAAKAAEPKAAPAKK